MINQRTELIISEQYKIQVTEEEITSVTLSYSDKKKFKSLNSKSKSLHASFNESFDHPLKMAWDATAFINFSFSA